MIYRILAYLWASPATAIGLMLVLVSALRGGSARIINGVIEAHGGTITRLLKKRIPLLGYPAALTLGHVVIGCDASCLDKCRQHEHVHVKQYERWGPFFIPAYLMTSLVIHLRGGDAYGDNPFEKEAVEKTIGRI
jgi:hypothetical protein